MTCPSCGIIPGTTLKVTHKQTKLCKICYKYYQKEQFKFYYEKTKVLKDKITKLCKVCNKEFLTARAIKSTCSDECRAEHKRRTNRVLQKKKKSLLKV